MKSFIAVILKENYDPEAFRASVIKLDGDFPFEADDMIELGNQYLEIYPDSYSNRNHQNVQIGYQIVRICILEKIIHDFDAALKVSFRRCFTDISQIDSEINSMVNNSGYGEVSAMIMSVSKNIDQVKLKIDMIPVGMIKERFVGGITNFFNIAYLLKHSLQRFDK